MVHMATYKGQPNQVRNTTLGVGALLAAAGFTVSKLSSEWHPGLIGMMLMLGAGWFAWTRHPAEIKDLPQDHDYLDQLDRWCQRIGIGTPQVLDHHDTKRGERYYLRVAMPDEDGKLMTPETFHGYWPKFRAVAGDGCRGVYISKPDKLNGGRCTMDVYWRDPDPSDAIAIRVSDNETRYAYSPAEAEAIRDEYGLNELASWGAPDPANRQGEW